MCVCVCRGQEEKRMGEGDCFIEPVGTEVLFFLIICNLSIEYLKRERYNHRLHKFGEK